MPSLPSILAQESDNFSRIIFFVIFAVIWGISALASMLNKKQEEARRRRLREEIERTQGRSPDVPSRPAPPPVRMDRSVPQPARVNRPVPQPVRKQRPAPIPVKRKAVKVPAPPPRTEVAAIASSLLQASAASIAKTEIQSPPSRPSLSRPSATAPALAQWLRPETLRTQFILTEILQPPLALREEKVEL